MNEKLSVLKSSSVSCDGISRHEDSSSIFGDWACGEPLTTQNLFIDFTPSEEIDNDFVQRKCCAFWDLVYKSPELRDLMVLPESVPYNKPDKVTSMPVESISSESRTSSEPVSCDRTALSVLEFAEYKGIVGDTFVPRLPTSCSVEPREYLENDPTAGTIGALSVINKACKCDGKCKSCRNKQPKGGIPASTPDVKHLCRTMRDWDCDHPKCRPVCKSRHREWKGEIQNTSAELLLERKPKAECCRRWPTEVYPNSPCPLLGRTRRIAVKDRNTFEKRDLVRICQAPVDDKVDLPYLKLAEIAKNLGAWKQVRARCAFCSCRGPCCSCNRQRYSPRDAERAAGRRADMHQFDARVKTECSKMKIMYDV